jgi:trehalose 6-phosphate phosphatase
MRDSTRSLLTRLTALYPCVIVSGRARADLVGKLDGIQVARVIGNHGAETETTTRKRRSRIEKWKTALEPEAASFPGVWVEDKGLSLTVHYRHADHKAEVRRRILAVAQGLDHARVFGGKQVINLVAESAPHKGQALAIERDRLGCDSVLFVGDDENDEHAFEMAGDIVPVRVGKKHGSHARYYLRSQAEIDKLLELLLLDAQKVRDADRL